MKFWYLIIFCFLITANLDYKSINHNFKNNDTNFKVNEKYKKKEKSIHKYIKFSVDKKILNIDKEGDFFQLDLNYYCSEEDFYIKDIDDSECKFLYSANRINGGITFYLSNIFIIHNNLNIDTKYNKILCDISIKDKKINFTIFDNFEVNIEESASEFIEQFKDEGKRRRINKTLVSNYLQTNPKKILTDELYNKYKKLDITEAFSKYLEVSNIIALPTEILNNENKYLIIYKLEGEHNSLKLGFLYLFLEYKNNELIINNANYVKDISKYPLEYHKLKGFYP